MGMFTRMSDIIQANINAMLDKAEDPEKVLRLIIQDMQETLVELRSVAARNLALKKTLSRKISAQQSQCQEWQQKAERAMTKGREDLARAALIQKQQSQQKLEGLEQESDAVAEALENLQLDANKLQSKLAEAKQKQQQFKIRQQAGQARLNAKEQMHSDKVNQAINRFEHYEARIDELEAKVDAFDVVGQPQDLVSQFKSLEQDECIEKELEALRSKKAA